MSIEIYVLKLEKNKYYVGRTTNFERRMKEHMLGNGSAWTRKYKPIKVEQIIKNANIFDEDRYVKEYMAKYGIEQVRGGTYVNEKLDEIQIYSLQKEIWGSSDLCTRCGRSGHFINKCYAKTDINDNKIEISESDSSDEEMIVWICEKCDKGYEKKSDCVKHEKYCKGGKNKDKCYRCGRSGHYSSDCYASTHSKGYMIYN